MAFSEALKRRLAGVHDEEPARRVMAAKPSWPAQPPFFGGFISDVKTIVIHETDGWPPRNRSVEFVGNYTHAGQPRSGFGPQFYVSSDGTVARLIDDRLITWHATFLNNQALGIENGHRDSAAPVATAAGVVIEPWRPLSADAEDAPGQKFFALRHRFDNPFEVVFCWFPTATFSGPKGSTRVEPGMLFTEWQYRSLATLCRYLAEQALVPRNFPLLPWATREDDIDNPADPAASPRFRLIALADEKFFAITGETFPALGMGFDMYDRANLVAFRAQYHAAIIGPGLIPAIPEFALNHNNKRLNRAWLGLFKVFRGFHGHGFAGSVHIPWDDHTSCPGPLFDWHRFAREVWDWWWYPFDFDAGFARTTQFLRGYMGSPGADTPLIEYFFENTPDVPGPDPYVARSTPPDWPPGGILGPTSSPSTFRLERGTPIYAMANGDLVAARLLRPGAGASMSFVLVRHEVYHVRDAIVAAIVAANDPANPAAGAGAMLAKLGIPLPKLAPSWAGRIDYDQEPTTVYSLYMHLGGTDRMMFDTVVPDNPDWLNRLLIRKKECDLAINNAGALHPSLAAIPPGEFSRPAPPAANRPTSLELMRIDKDRLGTFLDELRRGDVATAPFRVSLVDAFGPTPIKVVLGDFLGLAGTIRVVGPIPVPGILVEVFSPGLIDPAFFTEVKGKTSWDPPVGVAHPAIPYISEWARKPSAAERMAMQGIGVNPDLVPWFDKVTITQLWNAQLSLSAILRTDGLVYHYSPLDFLRWINDVTWKSEWPKYKVVDAFGKDMQAPSKPRPRRVV
jgi:hypothetical protein